MRNSNLKIMIEGDSGRISADVDTIRFASRENPITEINLRTRRGENLKIAPLRGESQGENNGLPIIIGGTNASGKTSLLRGIRLVCDLLQLPIITATESMKCRNELKSMGIRFLELQFVAELGYSTSGFPIHLMSRRTHSTTFKSGRRYFNTLVRLTASKYREENVDTHRKTVFTEDLSDITTESFPLILENVLTIKYDVQNLIDGMEWRDGLRLRRIGHPKAIEKLHPNFELLVETKQNLLTFRNIKRDRNIESFLEESLHKNLDGLMLERYELWNNENERRLPIQFQCATIIEVNRSGTDETIEQLRKLVPTLTKKFSEWRTAPETLRKGLRKMMGGNQLFTALGLKTSDILYQPKDSPYLVLYDSPPEIIESLMMKPLDTLYYTWFGKYAWKNKQRAINVIMEGCLHDIVNYVTGAGSTNRILIGIKTTSSTIYGANYDVEWVDNDSEYTGTHVWPDQTFGKIPVDSHSKNIVKPELSEVLRELPFLAELMGMKKEDSHLLDVLVRFNAFTPIEEIDQPYLSSGQRQILALITAVRYAKEGSLILVDEPEISLHVDWQERLVEQLHAPLTNSRLIIATHSPDIVVRHRHLCSILKVDNEEGFYRKDESK